MLPPEYFPLAVGYRWTYASVDTPGVPGPDTLVVAVVADTVVGGNPAFRVRSEERRLGPGGPGGPPVPQVFSSCLPVRSIERESGTDTELEYLAEDVGLVRRLDAEGGGWALAACRVTPQGQAVLAPSSRCVVFQDQVHAPGGYR